MIKNKKIILGALSFATLTAPIASVIACGNCDSSDNNDTSFDRLFNQTRRGFIEKLKMVEKIDSSSLAITDDIFKIDFTNPKDPSALGVILNDQATLIPSEIGFKEMYYVEGVDLRTNTVTVRASVAAFDNYDPDENAPELMVNSTFFQITNFGVKYDLSKLTEISPRIGLLSIQQNIADPAKATAAQITQMLKDVINNQLASQVPQTVLGGFDVTNLTKGDDGAIADQDLTQSATSYKATITATGATSPYQNSTTLTINIPQLNWFDVSTLLKISAEGDTWVSPDPTKVPTPYIIEKLNAKVLEEINKVNPNVTWGDLFQIYTLDGTKPLGNTMDLSKATTINLNLAALPYSKNAVRNKLNIIVDLPIVTPGTPT